MVQWKDNVVLLYTYKLYNDRQYLIIYLSHNILLHHPSTWRYFFFRFRHVKLNDLHFMTMQDRYDIVHQEEGISIKSEITEVGERHEIKMYIYESWYKSPWKWLIYKRNVEQPKKIIKFTVRHNYSSAQDNTLLNTAMLELKNITIRLNSMASCQNGPTRHAYAWQIGPFWQDTIEFTKTLRILHARESGWVFIECTLDITGGVVSSRMLYIQCNAASTPTSVYQHF